MYPRVGTPPPGDQAEASRLIVQKMRELPADRAPPFDWAELQRRVQERRAVRRRAPEPRRLPRRAILLTGALASLLVGVLVAEHLIRNAAVPADRAVQSSIDHERVPESGLATHAARDPELVLRRAAAAERWLQSQPQDEPIVRVSTHLVVADLEDRIASVDDLLNVERLRNAHARVHALQLERAQLVDSLAQVRYAEILTTEPP